MKHEELKRRMEQVRERLNRADESHDPELTLAYLMFAVSYMADVLDKLVEQQAPDWAERAEAEYLEGVTA